MMNKKKKAPARAKAHESYILSTKLFCGYCKSAMTGVSGKGKMGKKYFYYQCVTNRKDKSCKKGTVNKSYIEELVITETRKLLTRDNIDKIASEVVLLCEQERNTDNLKRLKRLLKENACRMPTGWMLWVPSALPAHLPTAEAITAPSTTRNCRPGRQ